MNATLSTVASRHDHPPELEPAVVFVRRVSFLDRLALHLGIALIKWGRRPLTRDTRERRANRVEQQLARLERERLAERSLRLNAPVR